MEIGEVMDIAHVAHVLLANASLSFGVPSIIFQGAKITIFD